MTAQGAQGLMDAASFEDCDLDGDGRVSFHEFITICLDKKKVVTQENLYKVFDLFD